MLSLRRNSDPANERNNHPGWTILQAVLLFCIFFAFMAGIQFSTPDLPDNDGYYHIRFASLMRKEGWKPEFTWLPLTVLNPREFYDHHFLFHVGLIPFTFGDLRLGAKWAAVTFASLAFLSIWWLLRGQQVPYAGIWCLGVLASSQAFLYRMSITRAQSLSLLVLVIGLHWMLTRRYVWLLALGFLYVWLYDAFPLLPLVALIYGAGVWLAEGRFEWRPLFWASIGVALGLLINPYFPYNWVFVFRHLLPKLSDATSVSVGNEWFPYDTHQLMENSGFALVFFLSGVLALGLNDRKMDIRTASGLLLTFLFVWMLFQARRFVEYFPPFAVIFAAFAWKPMIETWQLKEGAPRDSRTFLGSVRLALPALVLLLLVALGSWRTLPDASESIQGSKPYDQFAGASRWLKENTSPGTRVFQTDWDDFPRLFYFNTSNTYLIGLDPTYMQLYDEPLYNLWVEITNGEIQELSNVIPANFGSKYVVSDLRHQDFLQQVEKDSGFEQVYRDEDSVVFRIH
jgi:hypothetical protein